MKKTILLWEMVGAVFIIIVGSLFHFILEWSGYWAPIGAIAPVNESVWEHLKLGLWPLIIFSLVEYGFLRNMTKNFIVAKLSSYLLITICILVIFYSYTTILGTEILIIDILSFVIGAIVGQIISYILLTKNQLRKSIVVVSWIGMISLILIFALFTYFPPQLPIFQDSVTGLYGIVEHH